MSNSPFPLHLDTYHCGSTLKVPATILQAYKGTGAFCTQDAECSSNECTYKSGAFSGKRCAHGCSRSPSWCTVADTAWNSGRYCTISAHCTTNRCSNQRCENPPPPPPPGQRRRRRSDYRLKRDIERVSTSKSGVPIYEFDYAFEGFTNPSRHVGTMAQDLLKLGYGPDVVSLDSEGYYEVDYDMIDVNAF